MISRTFELRKQYGKFSVVNADSLPGFDHVSSCQACGSSKPEHLIGVSAKGISLLVGSTCAGILTSGRVPGVDNALKGTGETYQDGEKVIVYPTQEWQNALHVKAFGCEYEPGKVVMGFSLNQFLANIWFTAHEYGKLSSKQYEKASEIMNR